MRYVMLPIYKTLFVSDIIAKVIC